MYRKVFFALILFVMIPASVFGQNITDSEIERLIKAKVETVRFFANNPILIAAVREQNAENLSLDTIKQRDQEWSSTNELTPFKLSLQQNAAGQFLKNRIQSNSAFSEAFLTDNQGANVAAYPATSDYWQGDEEKWTASFNNGSGKIFVGSVQNDQSTGLITTQISAPVIDRGKTIGVLIMGIKLSYIEDKKARISK